MKKFLQITDNRRLATDNFSHQDYTVARKRLVQYLASLGIQNQQVLQAIYELPRHHFVETGLAPLAYEDRTLSIGEGQTISQPSTVATMLQALNLQSHERVLEVGLGSGYQAALLAKLAGHVYAIERIPSLLFKARRILKELGYQNITLLGGDGTQGAPKHAPFDAMIVAAGGPSIPQPYLEQLAEGGRLILPVGSQQAQQLVLVKKNREGFTQTKLSECRFVPLKGKYGFAV